MNRLKLAMLCVACMAGSAIAQTPMTTPSDQGSAQSKGASTEEIRRAEGAISASDAEVKALESCVGADQAKALKEQSSKRTQERLMKAAMHPQTGWLVPPATDTAAWAEARYNECIKRENPDLQVAEDNKPMPCAAEHALLVEARKLAGQEGQKNRFREFIAASLPVMQEERTALIAELKQLCAANPTK